MLPIVSVIMPAYKTELFIRMAIESVQAQTFGEWELIVIDDGSPDQLSLIVEELSRVDSRIRFVHQENQGVSAARNRGIEEATGKYVSFLDSDDYWMPTFLEEMLTLLEQSGKLFGYCGHIKEISINKKRAIGQPYLKGNILKPIVFSKQQIWICSLMVVKKMLDEYQIRFAVGCRIGEDSEFIMKVATVAEAEAISLELSCYRYREGSASHSGWDQKQEDVLGVLQRVYDFIEGNYHWNDRIVVLSELKKRQSTQLYRIVWNLVGNSQFDHAMGILRSYPKIACSSGRKWTHTLKLKVLNTKSNWIWKMIFIFEKIRS